MDDDEGGGGGVGGDCRRRSGHRSHGEHGRDGEAGVGVGDGAIGSRRMEHPRGKTKEGGAIPSMGAGSGKGRSSAGSEEGGGSRKRRGGEAAAVDANRWGRDGAANGEMIWSNAKETEKGFLQVKMSLR